MKEINQIVKYIDTCVKQLEALEYTKNVPLALKLLGAIEAGIYFTEIPNSWQSRVDGAMNRVAQDRPEEKGISTEIPGIIKVTMEDIMGGKISPSGVTPVAGPQTVVPQGAHTLPAPAPAILAG